MKHFFIFICAFLYLNTLKAQDRDSISTQSKDTTALKEVIVVCERNQLHLKQEKSLASVDDFLEKAHKATMIKRGNYAWEPTLNNMTSERLNVTIDGMQIFGACTDKMDPVTSYVDVSNLDNIAINSGQEGTEHGHNIGGSIDLKLHKNQFKNTGFKSNIDLGYETNSNYTSGGLNLKYATNSYYINADGIYRNSHNYDAGNNTEILYSQFQKYNIAVQTGVKLNENHSVHGHFIFDEAHNIGYPALTMDVGIAKAMIGSVTHSFKNPNTTFNSWETKLYFNTITHNMDDSKRPDVPIRMDMPGWSDTFGFYSKAETKITNRHFLNLNVNGYYNTALAEMTMYPANPNEAAMFMYTWPDVRTRYCGIYLKDHFKISDHKSLTSSARFGFHNNHIANTVGLESLQIFYPNLDDSKNRILTSLSSGYQINKTNSSYNFSVGYGERAPSVSESYGFYLFNSFDNYDYIGNPNLKKERAFESNLKTNFKLNKWHLNWEASAFYILDYIIGETDSSLSAMTIGANGVRIYKALPHALIFDTYLIASYQISSQISCNATIGYNYGEGQHSEALPLIKPLSYAAAFNYNTKTFNASILLEGNGNQSRYSSYYGENRTSDYAILNLNFGHSIALKLNKMILKYGVENILDTYYSTYADWNNIPRQGRNFYANISYLIN